MTPLFPDFDAFFIHEESKFMEMSHFIDDKTLKSRPIPIKLAQELLMEEEYQLESQYEMAEKNLEMLSLITGTPRSKLIHTESQISYYTDSEDDENDEEEENFMISSFNKIPSVKFFDNLNAKYDSRTSRASSDASAMTNVSNDSEHSTRDEESRKVNGINDEMIFQMEL